MFADGSLGVRCIWWLLQCSHLMVPLCLVVCPVGARLPPLPEKLKKVGFKWGASGGVRAKNSLGDAFIGQNNDFTRG